MGLRRTGSDDVTWWALASAAMSPVVLVAAWLLAGAVQPSSYQPLRDTISVLAGPSATDRWIMTVALFAVGGCYLVTAAGLPGLWGVGRALLIVAGIASVGLASSPVPAHGTTPRHVAWTVVGAVTLTLWPAVARRRAAPQSPVLSARSTVVATALFVVLLAWTIFEARRGEFLGLAERLSTFVQTSWPLVVAVALLRNGPARRPAVGSAEVISRP